MVDARAVARAFALGDPLGGATEVDRGEQGVVWRLATDGGTWAVKVLTGPADEASAAADVAFQELAAARVELPRPRRTVAGTVLLAADAAGADGPVRVSAWVDLDPGVTATPADLGRVIAALHLVDAPADRDVEPWFADGVDAAAWDGLLAAGRAAGEPWVGGLDRAVPLLLDLARVVVPADPARLRTCHRDLNDVNVRRTRSGGLVVLDWEGSGPADPARELCALLVVQTLRAPVDRAVELYAAYRRAGGPARVRDLADFSTVSVLADNLVALYARATLDPHAADPQRAFARQQLDWMLADPSRVSLPAVEHLLARLGP